MACDILNAQKTLIVKDEQSSKSLLGTASSAGKWSPDSKNFLFGLCRGLLR
jgi:hypothetical protein